MSNSTPDQDARKGAVEGSGRKTNVSLAGQLGHRDQDPLLKSSDSDFPEAGNNEEHTGEPRVKNESAEDTTGCSPSEVQEDDPGFRQKKNQNKSKDDPLAA